MPLPPSGPLGFNRINQELGCAAPYATANSSINSAAYRTLAAVPAGQIAISCFYGKSPSPAVTVEWAIMAGGGGSGRNVGGGGGAGGLLTNIDRPFAPGTAINPAATVFPYSPGTSYTIGVGGGGGGAPANPGTGNGSQGAQSDITGGPLAICILGGGFGASGVSPILANRTGGAGGSGGGGGGIPGNNGGATGNAFGQVVYAACRGGNGTTLSVSTTGGGGGGANAVGANGTPPARGGDGGNGVTWMGICQFGGGGGGSSTPTSTGISNGGAGGGGRGGSPLTPTIVGAFGVAGTVNTGGGGGASRGPCAGTAGGSGVVIIGYPAPQKATGGTLNPTVPGKVYHVFTGGGTFTWT